MSRPYKYTPADTAAFELLRSLTESHSPKAAWNKLSPAQADSINELLKNHPELKSTGKATGLSSAVRDHDRPGDYSSLPSTPRKLTASAFQQLQKERYREDLGRHSSLPNTPRRLPTRMYQEIQQRSRHSMSQGIWTEERPATPNLMPVPLSITSRPTPTKATSDIPSWMNRSVPTQPFDAEAQLANDMSRLSDETEQILGHIHNSLLEAIEWEKQVRINTFRLITMRETGGNKKKDKGRNSGDGVQ